MPTIPSIRTSVENQNVLILDDHAKNGTFKRDDRGRLIAYAGGFSVVFPYETADGEKWAFRCWHSDLVNSKKRYQTIAEAIKKSKLDFLCEFQYIEKGINVEGIIYPTTRMQWIDGMTIKDYICQNKNSKDLLVSLADNFHKMTEAMHIQSLAHGDLQHGNILVDKNHQLHLVDYDSFYCPRLEGEDDTVTGLPDYQHPARIANKSVSKKLDYFSELIIYLSILAITENPALVDKYNVENADRLLFAKEDFIDLEQSEIYKDIQSLGNECKGLLGVLVAYLKCTSIEELLPFDIFLLEKQISFTSSATKAVRNTQTIIIEWDVPFEAEVFLKKGNNDDIEKCENKGSVSTVLSKSITYELIVRLSEGSEIKKSVTIDAFDECVIDFTADKYYIFPKIPVILSWKVKNAKKVWLDNEQVEDNGSKVIEPEKKIAVVLSVQDEFGIKKKKINIGILPIPQIKALLVPTPEIVNNISLAIRQPRYSVDVRFPIIYIDWIRTKVPKIHSFKELGLNVELSPSSTRFSLKQIIKKVYNNLTKK